MNDKDKSEPSFQNEVKKARKEIVRSLIFAFAALAVLIIACFAWFTNNTKVLATTGSIQVLGSRYELAGKGTTDNESGYGIFYNSATKNFTFNTLPEGDISENKDKNSYLEATSGSQQSIRWRLNDESQIGNYSNGSSGIHPGSYGELQFYVVPKAVDTLNLDFQLNLNPLGDDGTSITDEQLNKLLKGHLLFYIETDENDWSWISWDKNTFSYQFNISNEKDVNVPQLITLHWMWPEEVEVLVTNEQLKDKIATNREFLFYSADASIPSEEEIGTNIASGQVEELDTLYNRADRYIGSNLTWLEVELYAKPSTDLKAN